MKKINYFDKYKLKIERRETLTGNSIVLNGEPNYPNGYLLGILVGHEPMNLRHFRQLSLEEEIQVIRKIINFGKINERYPLVHEFGQIAIYSKKSYVYDTLQNGSVFGDMDVFSNELDEKEENPIMILPSDDMLGLIQECLKLNLQDL